MNSVLVSLEGGVLGASLQAEASRLLLKLPHEPKLDAWLATGHWDETMVEVHLTASVVIFDTSKRHVLLLDRGGRLMQPGGHVESTDLTIQAAAKRELHEETGLMDARFTAEPIAVDLHSVSEPGRPCHLDFRFAAVANGDGDAPMGDEAWRARWVSVEVARKDVYIGELVEAALAATTA